MWYDEGPTNNMCTSVDKIAGLKTVKNFLVDSKNKKLIGKCDQQYRKLYILSLILTINSHKLQILQKKKLRLPE